MLVGGIHRIFLGFIRIQRDQSGYRVLASNRLDVGNDIGIVLVELFLSYPAREWRSDLAKIVVAIDSVAIVLKSQ